MTRPILVEDVAACARTLFIDAGYKNSDPAAAPFVKLFGHKLKAIGDAKLTAEFTGIKVGTILNWVKNSNTPAPIWATVRAKNLAMADMYAKGATLEECARKFNRAVGGARETIRHIRAKYGVDMIPYRRVRKTYHIEQKLIPNEQCT